MAHHSASNPPKPADDDDARHPFGSPRFFIGQNSRGNWVVQDQHGLHGGLFVSRGEALRFAMLGERGCPRAVTMVPGVLELGLQQPVEASDGGLAMRLRPALRPSAGGRRLNVNG